MNEKIALSRRTVVKGAAWTVPAVAVATMAPMAAASGRSGNLTCIAPGGTENASPVLAYVSISGSTMTLHTKSGPTNAAIDVTVRFAGFAEFHRNYTTSPVNPGDNQIHFTPGDTLSFTLPRAPKLTAQGKIDGDDWFQVETVHSTDCVTA